jgi:hypothetical protein
VNLTLINIWKQLLACVFLSGVRSLVLVGKGGRLNTVSFCSNTESSRPRHVAAVCLGMSCVRISRTALGKTVCSSLNWLSFFLFLYKYQTFQKHLYVSPFFFDTCHTFIMLSMVPSEGPFLKKAIWEFIIIITVSEWLYEFHKSGEEFSRVWPT